MAEQVRKVRGRQSWLKRAVKWLAIGGVVMSVATVGSVEVTSRSSFCNSCHIMNTYYDSWASGTHAEVACVECHIEPGARNYVSAKLNGLGQVVDDLLNRTSTKPSASVSDFACSRSGCHTSAELVAADQKERPYFFSHDVHLKDVHHSGIEIHCTTCHSHIQGGNHFEVNTNTCITCHLVPAVRDAPATRTAPMLVQASSTGGGDDTGTDADLADGARGTGTAGSWPHAADAAPNTCQTCHEPPLEPFEHRGLLVDHSEYLSHGAACDACHSGATAPASPVTDTQCIACHDFGMDKAPPVEEMHRIHTTGRHKVECFSCHGVTRHGTAAQTMSLNQFECRECHAGQHDVQRDAYLFQDTGGEDVGPDRIAVSPMFMAHVHCTGCHVQESPLAAELPSAATVARAVPEACDRCHQAGFGEQMVGLWQRTTRQLYDEVTALLPSPGAQWPVTSEGRDGVERARRLLDLVRVDGSWGVHNPKYTEQLINEARQRLIEAGALEADRGDAAPAGPAEPGP